ncbi:hypothetical protein ACWC9U_30605 [Streptomyces sp. 900116325]
MDTSRTPLWAGQQSRPWQRDIWATARTAILTPDRGPRTWDSQMRPPSPRATLEE